MMIDKDGETKIVHIRFNLTPTEDPLICLEVKATSLDALIEAVETQKNRIDSPFSSLLCVLQDAREIRDGRKDVTQ